MMRVPLDIGATAKTPRPCTGELRTSMSAEVTMGGPPFVGCGCVDMSIFFLRGMGPSDGNGRLDRRVVLVVHELKIIERVVENAGRTAHEVELRQRERYARQLLVYLLQMVRIEMAIATGPHEVADLEIALLREHVREQRIRGDIERHAQKNVRAALVELAAQFVVRHVELEERVAGHELHLVELAHVPGADDDAARIRIRAQLSDH